ncbi:MAG: ATP-binding protein, partial [Euryarchaeota archaeon]|nr:ATP-binding protein [Euryarchaeota archaeon]
MEFPDFLIQNIWWKGKEYLKDDKHLREYREKKYQWQPAILRDIKLIPGNLFSLRGPRQIGKTTLVKLIIESLIQGGIQENAVFYTSCDSILDFGELRKSLRTYHEYADSLGINEKYVFLDEISGIQNWQKAVKILADSGELRNTCIFLTGSHTLDIKKGFDMLPGRTGKYGEDFLLLPLTFREYVSLIRPEIKLEKLQSFSIKEINSVVRNALPFEHELKILFSQYLLTGGFPLAINEFHTGKVIPDYIYEIYSRWVIGDIVKWGKQEKILKQILRTAILKQSTPVSFDSFAKEAEIKSHKTVSA